MRKEENHRIRWITYKEAERLLEELPGHLQDMASFTLATGLRQSNVTELKRCDVDLVRQHAMVHPDNSKTCAKQNLSSTKNGNELLWSGLKNTPQHLILRHVLVTVTFEAFRQDS